MTDPLSITASAAGLVSLGLTVCSGLLNYYSAWKDQPSDVSTMCQSLEALGKTLKVLDQKVRLPLLDRETVDRVTDIIVSCAASIYALKSKLEKISDTKPGIGSHLLRAQYPFQQKTLEKLQRIISDIRGNLNLAATTLQFDIYIHSLNHLDLINRDVKEMIRGQEIERSRALNAEERHLIDWLSPLDVTSKHFYARGRAQEGTGQWLLESVEFKTWLEIGGKVLWCPGMPGAGKTIQASTVIERLRRDCKQDKIGLAYIYFVYNDAYQTLVSLLGSLLQQFAKQSTALLEEVKLCYEHCTNDKIAPTVEEIAGLLHLQVEKFDKVFIVLDALDECPEVDKTREKVLARVRGLLPKARLMVTSRPLSSIEGRFKNDIRLEIRAQEQDLQKFIESQMDQDNLSALLEGHDDVRSSIVTTIMGKVNGMFLIAVLHMNSLAKEDNVRDLKESLQRLPEDLDKTYDNALERIKNQDSRKVARAEQVLKLINCAKRPLKLEEMRQALSIREGDTFLDTDAVPGTESLISTCCGLVVVEDESQIVRLVHYTAEEYFARKVERYRNREAHAFFACILITYLGFTQFEKWSLKDAMYEELEILGRDPFYFKDDAVELCMKRLLGDNILVSYGAENLGYHAREAFTKLAHESSLRFTTTSLQNSKSDKLWTLNRLMLDFLQKQDSLAFLNEVNHYFEKCRITGGVKTDWSYYFCGPTNVTSLQMAASFGIQHLVEYYLIQGANIDARDSVGNTALHKASENGHVGVVQVLLDSGATVSLQDQAGRDALLWAVSENRLSVAHLLLQSGADPAIKASIDSCAYFYAAICGYEEILEVLARYEIDISRLSKQMEVILWHAARRGHESVIRFLIRGAKHWNIYKKHLSWAMAPAADCVAVMKILFEAGAEVNSPFLIVGDKNQETSILWNDDQPLHVAVDRESLDGVTFLLSNGADANALSRHGDSALVQACRREYLKVSADIIMIVHQLLSNGADPAMEDRKFGRTSLAWAVVGGNEELAQLVLQYEDCSADQKNLMLYLSLIYHNIHDTNGEDVDRLLCQKQVEELGTMPKLLLIYIPARRGYGRVVRKFLDSGAVLEAKYPKGNTALHQAARGGHVAVVELLLAKEANINSRDHEDDSTPLMLAARHGYTEIAELLLNRGADLDAISTAFYGSTALAQAIGQGHVATATLLLERGANPNCGFHRSGRSTPLHHVAANRFSRTKFFEPSCVLLSPTIELLLEKGADLEARDSDDRTPLALAVSCYNFEAAKLLLEKGADVEARDSNDRTPLALAVLCCNLKAAKLLSEKGADFEANDNLDLTPLALAVREGNSKAVKFLLDKGVNPHSFSPSRTRHYDVWEHDFRRAAKLVLKAQWKTIDTVGIAY